MLNNMKDLRKKKNLTLRSLVNKTGLSIGSLCDIENGKNEPKILTAYKIAEGLNIGDVRRVFPPK